MTLDDHVGDIIRKGREACGVAAGLAARAAGLSEADYDTLEETGRAAAAVQFQVLGQAIGLNGAKLARIAGGWLPAPRDLSLWRELRRITTTANDLTVHCYLAWDEVSREAADELFAVERAGLANPRPGPSSSSRRSSITPSGSPANRACWAKPKRNG